MNIPEEFGKYLLLKKLAEDALGETFRAGKVGRDGIEQVVLLRVLNGAGMDGEKLWQQIAGRAAVQQALRSPNVGSGVDLARVRNFPYVAYDYISGKNLATLLAAAARQHMPIPPDHALLICERLAIGLAAAYETRFQDERLLHGFVVPHLAMVSNEGEARLLGFEVAPGLRELWAGGWSSPELRPYIAPEAAASVTPSKVDDVYSLGAILFELLTGQPLPAAGPEQAAAAIDGAVAAHDESPLPATLAALLKKSLVPREQRIADAATWHKAISKLMIEGQYSSTTFNLAFFMHNLFRDEIERESQEIMAEKKLELPARIGAAGGPAPGGTVPGASGHPVAGAGLRPGPGAGGAAAGAGAGGRAAGDIGGMAAAGAASAVAPGSLFDTGSADSHADMREVSGVREATWPGSKAQAGAGSGRGKSALWIGLAAAAVVLLAVGGWFFFGRGGGKGAAAAPAPVPVAKALPAPGPDPAQQAVLQAQIQQIIEARSKDMESKLKSQYDDQLKQLQKKLEDSRKTNADATRAERAAAGAPGSAGAAQQAESKTAPPRSDSPAQQAAASTAVPAPAPAQPLPSSPGEKSTTPAGAGTGAAAAPQTDAGPAGAAVAAAPAHQPQVQVGDLVSYGPGVIQPKFISRPEAHYPVMARRMNRTAQVSLNLKVLVDERGRVVEAERIGNPAGYGFDEAALESARSARYQPATKDGVLVKMWIPLKVEFKP